MKLLLSLVFALVTYSSPAPAWWDSVQKVKIDAASADVHNSAVRRKYKKSRYYKPRIQRAYQYRSRTNIFRRYAAASASRSCLKSETAAVLQRLEARIGKVQVISTCRPGATIAGTGRPSYHRYGMAVDFNTPRKAEAISFLRSQGVFVMTYCGLTHVHFNNGQTGASFCGSKSRYMSARKKWRRR